MQIYSSVRFWLLFHNPLAPPTPRSLSVSSSCSKPILKDFTLALESSGEAHSRTSGLRPHRQPLSRTRQYSVFAVSWSRSKSVFGSAKHVWAHCSLSLLRCIMVYECKPVPSAFDLFIYLHLQICSIFKITYHYGQTEILYLQSCYFTRN